MKKFSPLLSVAFLIFSTLAFADSASTRGGEAKEVVVNVGTVVIPGGFDANSDVFAVVSGFFPNGCYKWQGAEVTHDFAARTHEVRSKALVTPGMCIMVMVPWSEEVQLGKLGAGDHSVRFVNGDGTYMEKKIKLE